MTSPREENSKSAQTAYRYDIFKGQTNSEGVVSKLRSVGTAFIREGQGTFFIILKTFLDDRYYLLPDHRSDSQNNYMILTREDSKIPGRKYFWNVVGEARVLMGPNHGLMKLSWDVLSNDLYMSMEPIPTGTNPPVEDGCQERVIHSAA